MPHPSPNISYEAILPYKAKGIGEDELSYGYDAGILDYGRFNQDNSIDDVVLDEEFEI